MGQRDTVSLNSDRATRDDIMERELFVFAGMTVVVTLYELQTRDRLTSISYTHTNT